MSSFSYWIDELLRLVFGQCLLGEIPLEIDVEESGNPAERHRGAVHLLDGAQVAEVGPLHGLLGVRRGLADVAAVRRRHGLQIGKGAQLVRHLLAQPHDVL
jgi:hypothetical protein